MIWFVQLANDDLLFLYKICSAQIIGGVCSEVIFKVISFDVMNDFSYSLRPIIYELFDLFTHKFVNLFFVLYKVSQ